jgi:hypothetical protein
VLDVDEASAPAKVVIEVFAPIRRGRDEHLFMFLLFSDDLGAKRSMGRGDKKEVGDGLRRG